MATDKLKVERVEGPCVAPVDQQVVFGAIANAPNLVRWLARQGMPGSGSGQTFGTSFGDLGTYEVLAGCPGGGGSNKTATIEIAASCEAEPVKVISLPMSPGSDVRVGYYGHFRAPSPEYQFGDCARTDERCIYLEEIDWGEQAIDLRADDRKRVSLADFEAQKAAIRANCEAILEDFRLREGPDELGGIQIPLVAEFVLAEALPSVHEAKHRENWRALMIEPFTAIASEIVSSAACSGCEGSVEEGGIVEDLEEAFSARLADQFGDPPHFLKEEARVYDEQNSLYSQFVALVNQTAQAEGWGKCE